MNNDGFPNHQFGNLLKRLPREKAKQKKRSGGGDEPPRHQAPRLLPPPSAPMQVARVFVAEMITDEDGALILRYWRGGFWRWRRSHWKQAEARLTRRLLYAFTEHALYESGVGPLPWNPNRKKIDDLIDALIALVLLPSEIEQPDWLDGRESGTIVSCANGLLDVERRVLLPHTPHYFNLVSVPFDYEPKARVPREWKNFLKSLWPGDQQSRKALAQWCGYVISGRLDQQKILLLVGPTRAGKGVISRLLGALIGPRNVCGPTLNSLSGDFGLAPLIGKSLAIIADARISGRHGSVVVERLLSISGEDTLTVNIKFKEQWTGKLPCRVVVISNELPDLADASAAIVGRFLVLALARSWIGKEDIGLEARLRSQLPGLLNWALMGLAQLERKGRFTQPATADDAISSLRDLASPTKAFIRDRCEVNPDCHVGVDELYAAYRTWADDNGHPRIAKPTFGRNLKAAMPRLRLSQLRSGEVRTRVYVGIKLKQAASDE